MISTVVPIIFVILEYIFLRKGPLNTKRKIKEMIFAFARITFIFYLISILNWEISSVGKITIQIIYAISELYVILSKISVKNNGYEENKKILRFFAVYLVLLVSFIFFIGFALANKDITNIEYTTFVIWGAFVLNFCSVIYIIAKEESNNKKTSIVKSIIQIIKESYKESKTNLLLYLGITFGGTFCVLNDFYKYLFFFAIANFYAKYFKTALIQFIISIIIMLLNNIELFYLYAIVTCIYNGVIAYNIFKNK